MSDILLDHGEVIAASVVSVLPWAYFRFDEMAKSLVSIRFYSCIPFWKSVPSGCGCRMYRVLPLGRGGMPDKTRGRCSDRGQLLARRRGRDLVERCYFFLFRLERNVRISAG